MRKTYRYTLLIVESPTISNIINNFNLPYLEVLATHGFCWKPVYDFRENKLSYKADPDKRDIRRDLKNKAPWADRIIVATDTDSAGEFIAYTLKRYLKKYDVYRGHLQNLSPAGITYLLEHSHPFSEKNIQSMTNRYICNSLLERTLADKTGNRTWIKLLTLLFFKTDIALTSFRVMNGNPTSLLKSTHPVKVRYNDNIELRKAESERHFSIPKVWNTADILSILSYSYKSLTEAQNDLNDLFTLIPEDLSHGIISYPRTTAKGYYHRTWNEFYQKWIRNHSPESFLPEPLWIKLKSSDPHEGIHPIDLSITPEIIRTKIQKKYFDLYKKIYEHHQKTLGMPQENVSHIYKSTGLAKNMTVYGDTRMSSKVTAIPVVNISEFLNYLYAFKAARPSGYGSLMDKLKSTDWISFDNGYIQPGETLKVMMTKVRDWESLAYVLTYFREGIQSKANWPDSKLFANIQRIANTIR